MPVHSLKITYLSHDNQCILNRNSEFISSHSYYFSDMDLITYTQAPKHSAAKLNEAWAVSSDNLEITTKINQMFTLSGGIASKMERKTSALTQPNSFALLFTIKAVLLMSHHMTL